MQTRKRADIILLILVIALGAAGGWFFTAYAAPARDGGAPTPTLTPSATPTPTPLPSETPTPDPTATSTSAPLAAADPAENRQSESNIIEEDADRQAARTAWLNLALGVLLGLGVIVIAALVALNIRAAGRP